MSVIVHHADDLAWNQTPLSPMKMMEKEKCLASAGDLIVANVILKTPKSKVP